MDADFEGDVFDAEPLPLLYDAADGDDYEVQEAGSADLPSPDTSTSSTDCEGTHIENFDPSKCAGAAIGRHPSVFEQHADRLKALEQGIWGPFKNEEEWGLGKWLATCGVSQNKINTFMKLPIVQGLNLSFDSARTLLKTVDALPSGPEWQTFDVQVKGDKLGEKSTPLVESYELYYRNILECVQDILGDPTLKEHMQFSPTKIWSDTTKTNRFYSEMWTGNWWWETQTRLPNSSTIVPIIFATDKTNLSLFAGDKVAWPVCMTIGNIAKDVRRKLSSRAWRLVAYLPVAKLDCFRTDEGRRTGNYEIYHECMRQICDPLYSLGPESEGTTMICSDGNIRRI
ncbi:hypothetical protein SISSUDRAFT_989170, partial [Sistotremastrum suecicum HHB10207 ss-3]